MNYKKKLVKIEREVEAIQKFIYTEVILVFVKGDVCVE